MADRNTLLSAAMPRTQRRVVRAALLRKEWQEQRWRFFLGTFVLSGVVAGLLRAQVIPYDEAILFVYGGVGLVMVIFLAIGPVAAEKADRTWAFLLAQPVSRADVLVAKWQMGLLELVGMMAIATGAGLLAMWSRGMYGHIGLLDPGLQGPDAWPGWLIAWCCAHPMGWFTLVAAVATLSLACWFTPLFFVLTRARNEFTAALGGLLLTIVLLAWLLQIPVGWETKSVLCYTGLLNPLSPLVVDVRADFLLFLILFHIALWLVCPIVIVRRLGAKAGRV